MNIIVHLLIAYSVRKTVYKQTGEKLNLAGFLYGNILPDISSRFGNAPHFLNSSLDFVIDSSYKLTESTYRRRFCSFLNSRRAGVISHYLSDYFCLAHSEHFYDGSFKHHLYEFKMLFSFRRGLLFFNRQNSRNIENISSISTFIRENSEKYLNETHIPINDICYALNVSVCITKYLLNQSRYNEKISDKMISEAL